MPRYHPSKDAALLAGAIYSDYFHTRVELEAYNGWVLVLAPKSLEALKWPLYDLLDEVEVDLSKFQRLRVRPASYRRPPSIDAPVRKPVAPPPRPPAPPTAAAPVKPPPPPMR